MAAATFKDRGVIASAAISTANTNLDGTGTIVTVATGSAKGTIIERVIAKASVTTTAGLIHIFIDDGSNVRLIHQMTVDAITVDSTTAAWSETWVPSTTTFGELILPENYELQAAPYNAEAFNVFAIGGDY